MNGKIIECVPNFSEGRVTATIDKIAQAVEETPGVDLLDVDIGESANRTVMTFVGGPDEILEAAFRAMATAANLIDMRRHEGTHPRVGATDVCPFVPLMGANMDDCIKLSERLAARVSSELNIPAYLYAASARVNERRKLSFIRRGQYEKFAERMTNEGLLPDYPARQFNEKSGVSIIGARNLLIAYNISLDSQSVSKAETIAAKMRKMRINGDENLADCTAIGWYAEEYNCAQVSMNLMDMRTTSLHHVFLTVAKLAEELGAAVAQSEVIGLVPLKALVETGRYHWNSSSKPGKCNETRLIETAIASLKLRQSHQQSFDPEKKIIEYRLKNLGYGLNTDGFAF
jgi:glutamate formiminotransferase